MSDHNVFAGAHFDRLGHRRRDREWLEKKRRDADTALVPVWQNRNLIATGDSGDSVLLSPDAIEMPDTDRLILLGRLDGRTCFAVDLGDNADPPPLADHGQFRTLRTVGMALPADRAALSAYAQAMVLWHRRQRHCSHCGSVTRSEEAGHLRRCVNADCGQGFFPRIDPAIIVLVERDGQALLGRQAGWPDGVYSTIAGFVEPGESLEDAVRREVAEETGVVVGSVRYHSSQPWPFPSSLMLGFFAEGLTTQISLPDQELEDARWFSREVLREQYCRGLVRVPQPVSISHRLIAAWFDDGQPGQLAELYTQYLQPA